MKIGDYVVLERIGYGSTSSVFKVKKGNELFAMKCINAEHIPGIKEEIKFLSFVKHPNLVPALSMFLFSNENSDDRFCIVFPLAQTTICNISLSTHRNKKDQKGLSWVNISKEQKWNWFVSLTMALLEMKNKGYFHGDIHPKNILLLNNTAMWCDFGVSCKYKPDKMYVYGSFPFCSPASFIQNGWYNDCEEAKLIEHKIEPETPFQGDIFSLGLLLSYLFSDNKRNFLQSNSRKNDLSDVRDNMWRYLLYPDVFWNCVTSSYGPKVDEIIQLCCNISPNKRITLEDLVPLLQNVYIE